MKTGPKPTTKEQFFNKVMPVPFSGCWIWMGHMARNGYGLLNSKRAHRVSYEFYCGPIEDGLFILHSCDTPSCVNPDHLRPGTPADNMADAVARARVHNRFQSSKTHCPAGHLYSEENTRMYRGSRHCIECTKKRARKWDRDNPDRVRNRRRATYYRDPERARAEALAYYHANKKLKGAIAK